MAYDEVARLLAEQTAVDCAMPEAELMLSGLANRRRLAVLRLAGDTGEAAGLLLIGDAPPPSSDRVHEWTTSPIERRGASIRLSFEWRTHAYRALFDVLKGDLAARPGRPGVILGVEGTYALNPSLAGQSMAVALARRAAEAAVRTLLAELRAALEYRSSGPAGGISSSQLQGAPLGVGSEIFPP